VTGAAVSAEAPGETAALDRTKELSADDAEAEEEELEMEKEADVDFIEGPTTTTIT
jgi:hypothetical protein